MSTELTAGANVPASILIPLLVTGGLIIVYVAHLAFGVYVFHRTGDPAALRDAGIFSAAPLVAATRAYLAWRDRERRPPLGRGPKSGARTRKKPIDAHDSAGDSARP